LKAFVCVKMIWIKGIGEFPSGVAPIYQCCFLTLLTQVQIHNDILACCDKTRSVDAPQEWDPLVRVVFKLIESFYVISLLLGIGLQVVGTNLEVIVEAS
jgi:hypothetical protein